MGKRIISQARGKGSLTYRVRKKAFQYRVKYPMHEGPARIVKLFHSAAHSAPLLKINVANESFYNVAHAGAVEGNTLQIGKEIQTGNIVQLKHIPPATRVFNIERSPGDGGKMVRASGSSAFINKRYDHGKIGIIMPHKKEVIFDEHCRATIGIIAGDGRLLKPFVKAGVRYHKMKTRNKLYPRTSAVSMNAIDHPFGSGRGKHVKSKTAKRNAPPGKKVGHLSPSRTGRKKR